MVRKFILFLAIGSVIVTLAGKIPATFAKTSAKPVSPVRQPYDPTLTSRNMACYAASVKNDPQNAIGYNLLAQCYLQHSRETGDMGEAISAMKSAQRSLKIRTHNNQAAAYTLAQSLVVQHKFSEALETLKSSQLVTPGSSASCLAIEIMIELGDYQTARELARTNLLDFKSAPVKVTKARLYEIEGRLDRAIEMIRSAQLKTDQDFDMPHESVAWFHLREGDLLALKGDQTGAEAAYLKAISIFPNDFKAMAGLTKLASIRKDWDQVVKWGSQSIEFVPNPEIIALVADAFMSKGMTKEAESRYSLIESIAKISYSQGVSYDRQRACYLADHKKNLPEAVSLARRELKVRHDLYAYDTLAWTLCQSGDFKEAEKSMRIALKEGTCDARLFYHASRIFQANGDSQLSKQYSDRAYQLNPSLRSL